MAKAAKKRKRSAPGRATAPQPAEQVLPTTASGGTTSRKAKLVVVTLDETATDAVASDPPRLLFALGCEHTEVGYAADTDPNAITPRQHAEAAERLLDAVTDRYAGGSDACRSLGYLAVAGRFHLMLPAGRGRWRDAAKYTIHSLIFLAAVPAADAPGC